MTMETSQGNLILNVKFMDDDHKAMLDSLNALVAVSSSGAEAVAINEAFVDLVNLTCAHFEREEMSMLENGYPEYAQHKSEHSALIEQISALAQRLNVETNSVPSDEVVALLTNWVSQHIQTADRAYARYLREVGAANR
ncbi:MAG: hemerythrin family protein [Magnetospirillum sp.]|nr:hemerythrin family protein [Magnetospirillum sp.]